MREHSWGDALVVIDELALRDPVAWKEHLVRPRDLNDAASRAQRLGPGRRAHFERSRTTSRAALSLRRPRNRGWRNFPSRVHSVKSTCATSVGFTQCTPYVRL